MAERICVDCVTKWLPKALQTGRMTWDKLHPRVKAIMVREGYDKKGQKIVTVFK